MAVKKTGTANSGKRVNASKRPETVTALEKYAVPVDQLRWICDPKIFDFECTKDLAPLREFIGQERASRAVEFGLNMKNAGYNIFVAGPTGTGKTAMVKTYIAKLIKERQEKGEVQVFGVHLIMRLSVIVTP